MKDTNTASKHVYVAFLDVLGFGEIVKKNEPSHVENLFATIEMAYDDSTKVLKSKDEESVKYLRDKMPDHFLHQLTDVHVNALSLSDSVYLWTENDSAFSFARIVHYVNRMLAYFMIMGIPARGAIACGHVSFRTGNLGVGSPNVFGTGLVNAFELEGKQQWSGAIIDHDVINHLKLFREWGGSVVEQLHHDKWIIPYDVPLKDGTTQNYYSVNWTINFKKNDFSNKAEKIISQFEKHDKSIAEDSVKTKIENTQKYFLVMKKTRHKTATS